MPSLLFKKFRSSEVVELEFDNVEGLSVEEVRKKVSSSMKLPYESLLLVYGGRILKNGKNVTDYYVVAGCTIFVMSKAPKASTGPATRSENLGLLENRRILEMVSRIIGNPALLQGVMQGSALEGSAAVQRVLASPQLMANLADPDNVLEYVRDNPAVAAAMEDFIRQVLGSDEAVYEEQSLVNLLEDILDDQIAMMEEEEEEEEEREEGEQLALAQEQMFEHSQALQAHHQQQRQEQQNEQSGSIPRLNVTVGAAPPPTYEESSFNPTASQQHGSLLEPSSEGVAGITREQLASALVAAMGSTPVAPIPAHQDYQGTQLPVPSQRTFQSSHGAAPPLPPPRSMQREASTSSRSEQAGTLHNVLLEPPPPPYPTPFSSTNVSRSTSNPGETSGPISAALLQQALSQVMESTSSDHRPQAGLLGRGQASSRTRSSERAQHQAREGTHEMVDVSALTQRYRVQLNQLHLMGIMDDAASLQVLVATKGDITAALEILYSK